MIHGLAARAGRFDGDRQILLDLVLANELRQSLRAKLEFKRRIIFYRRRRDYPLFKIRSVSQRSRFTAPDQKHRAYAETEATALYQQRPSGYTGPLCVNYSRLFVAETGDFKLRFLQEPADVETGNLLRAVDWSSDGRRLLLELAEWQYEQPGATRSVLISDSKNCAFQQPDLAHI